MHKVPLRFHAENHGFNKRYASLSRATLNLHTTDHQALNYRTGALSKCPRACIRLNQCLTNPEKPNELAPLYLRRSRSFI